MLIAVEDKDRLFNGIFGNNVTPVVTAVETAVYTETETTVYSPVATPTNGGVITVIGSWQVVTSPAVYAKHALEYAFKQFQSPLASLGFDQPWVRTGSQKPIPPTLHAQILDYAYNWSRVRTFPKHYTGILDGRDYEVKDSTVVNMTSRAYIENYLTRYYLFVLQTATVTAAYTPATQPVITLTPTPTTVMPGITADVQAIVNHNLEFNQVPIMPGTLRGDIYDRVISKSIIDILSVEYLGPKKALPPGITWDDLKARNREAVLSYINSLGIKRGSTTQTPDFLPTAKGTSPLPYSQERQWWASTDRERAEWAVKEVLRDMGVRYVKGATMLTQQQADQVLAGALRWLQAVASDPVFVRDAGDQRDMQIAMGLINLNLLGNMGIAIGTKPDWQERARAAVTWWLGRTSDKTMTSTEYTEYLRQVIRTALSYWGNAVYTYLNKGGAGIPNPTEESVRAYVDSLLKQAISIQEPAATPTAVIQPVTTPTAVITPPYSPVVTPTPTVTLSVTEAARSGLNEALREGNYQNLARAKRYSTPGPVFFYLPVDLYDKMLEDAIIATKRIYAEAGGDPSSLTDQDWLNQIRLINNTALDRRFVLEATTTPTATEIVPITQVITVTPSTGTGVKTLEDMLVEVLGSVLPRFGLAQRYPTAFYIADASRRELLQTLYREGVRLSGTMKYHQPRAAIGGLSLSSSRIDEELRQRNILPESEDFSKVVTATPVISGDAALVEWAKTAPVFETYQACRTAAEDQVGRVPDRWRDCLTESDMIDQAVSHALIQRGIRPYPGSLELPEAAFDSVAEVGLAITQQMVYQRTYTPVVGGKVLQLAQ